MRMRKRTTVRIVTFLSAALIVAGVFAIRNTRKADALELYARASTERAFDGLVTSMAELSNALEKSQYLSDPALESALCTQIFGRAMTAQMAMEALPYASQELEQTAGFVAKVGDYAGALARTVGKTGGYSERELKNLKSLAETASVMKLNLQDMQSRITAGELSLEDVYRQTTHSEGGEGQVPLAGTAFQTIEQEFPELPTLIYDGPFSESMSSKKPLYLEGKAQVSQEQALAAAAKFLDTETAVMRASGECGGDVPCWTCTGHVNGTEYTVQVTKQGGEIWSVIGGRDVGRQSYSISQGLDRAEDLVKSWGIGELEESYHTVSDGVLLVNFHHNENGVRCYPDLIKVGVALDNGTLMSYDAQGYICAHTDRKLPTAKISREDAQAALSDSLRVQEHSLALIPSAGGQERLCHEFLCQTAAGERYIMYVNALTGDEEKILILLEDETGTLTV